jgi:2'-5' RNA ligase
MVRLFIAVEIEEEEVLSKVIMIRDRVVGCSSEVDLKGVEDENLHITLRFIGEVSDSLVQDIIKAMECVSGFKKFNIRLKGIGAFPTVSRPRVIWLGVTEGSAQLRIIRDCIEKGLRRLGIQAEREEFIPHITLARIKSFRPSRCLSNIFTELGDFEVGVTPVTKVKLKKSTLTPRGPIYSDLFEVGLAD